MISQARQAIFSRQAIYEPCTPPCELHGCHASRCLHIHEALDTQTRRERVDIFRAIADPTRRAILDELVDRPCQSLFEICGPLIMKHGINPSRQEISQHLHVLVAAGRMRTRREGRSKLHWFEGAPLKVIGERWPVSAGEDTSHSTDEGTEK